MVENFVCDLYESLELRTVKVANRLWMSPMCQYSAASDGVPTAWHLTHYGARAVGGAGMVMVESTAISPEQRTTVADLGLYTPEQVTGHRRLTDTIRALGSVPAIQLQIAGRKSSHRQPWEERGQQSAVQVHEGGWRTIGPSAIAFGDLTTPQEATSAELSDLLVRFTEAGRRAHAAGYDVAEVHAAHGYLLHQFLSPLSNTRQDEFGGSLENRMRYPLAAIAAVREGWPEDKPLLVRMTATDWVEGGVTLDEAAIFAKRLAGIGVDMLDITSGGLVIDGPRRFDPLYNVPFARPLADASGLPVVTVGLITKVEQVNRILGETAADAILVGRQLLRDPYWPLRHMPDDSPETWPPQYRRAV